MLILEIAGGVALGLLLLGLLGAALSYKSPRQRAFEQRQAIRLAHQMITSEQMDRLVLGPDMSRHPAMAHFLSAKED